MKNTTLGDKIKKIEDKIPASTTDSSTETNSGKPRAWAVPAPPPPPLIAAIGAIIVFISFLLFVSAGRPSENIDVVQGFGMCDNGGKANITGLLMAMDQESLFSSMKMWAPELDLATRPEQYAPVGRVQLDGCVIFALVDSTGEYYGFVLKTDGQGAYIVGLSRASPSEAPDNLSEKVYVRPRQ